MSETKYDPPALGWKEFTNIIDDKLETTSTTRHSLNPATGEANPDVPDSTAEDVDRTMEAARTAFKS